MTGVLPEGVAETGLTRRQALQGLLASGAALILPLLLRPSASYSADFFTQGETLIYKVRFLWFSDVGRVHISFAKEGPNYLASIRTEAKGVAAALAGHPKFLYRSRMEEVPGQRRLRCLEFFQLQERTGLSRRLTETFDYQKGIRTREFLKDGQPPKVRQFSISATTLLDDFLTAFYNMRLQAYGSVKAGARLQVNTIAKRGTSKISIHVEKEEGNPGQLMALVTTDQELLGSNPGKIKLLLDEELIPRQVIVASVLGLGDATGTLMEKLSYSKLKEEPSNDRTENRGDLPPLR